MSRASLIKTCTGATVTTVKSGESLTWIRLVVVPFSLALRMPGSSYRPSAAIDCNILVTFQEAQMRYFLLIETARCTFRRRHADHERDIYRVGIEFVEELQINGLQGIEVAEIAGTGREAIVGEQSIAPYMFVSWYAVKVACAGAFDIHLGLVDDKDDRSGRSALGTQAV